MTKSKKVLVRRKGRTVAIQRSVYEYNKRGAKERKQARIRSRLPQDEK